MELESQEIAFAKQLRGKRLLCEVPFTREDIEQLRDVLLPMRAEAWRYPTLSAIATAGIGVYYYNQGDFWHEFPNIDSPADQSAWGKRFEAFLSVQNLETFQSIRSERAHRYVAPILAHGGVPQSCLPDFFSLITGHGDREQSGADLIRSLKDEPTSMAHADQPVRRFIKYGGEVAEDFVSRFLALWEFYERGEMKARCGLPERVVKEFSSWWPEHQPKMRTNFRRMPRPELRIEPAGLVVYLYLPRCDNHSDIPSSAQWHVLNRIWAVTREHEIPLLPCDAWEVTGVGREYKLDGPTENIPVVFFDPISGKAILEPHLRRLPARVWALIKGHPGCEPLPETQEAYAQWPGHSIAVFDLSGRRQLRVGSNTFEVRQPFFYVDKDPSLPGVCDRNRNPVFNALPQIVWEGKANLSLTRNGESQGNIDIESSELPIILDKPGEYKIELRGPLGENLSNRFVFVPGLVIQPNPQVQWPNQNAVTWHISAESAVIKSGDATPPFTRNDSRLDFMVEYADGTINLDAEIPQLRWRLLPQQEGQADEYHREPLSVWLADLHNIDYPLLECVFGSFGEDTEVLLEGGSSKTKLMAQRQKSGDHNSWYFDLRILRDAMETSGKAEKYDLLIRSKDGRLHFRGLVLSISPRWDICRFKASWKRNGDQQVVQATWQESEKRIPDRWVVVIPLWRPWEDASLKHKLDETESGGYKWQLALPDLSPGRYVIKAVHAPWGCDKWIEAVAVQQQACDVYSEAWPETFVTQHVAPTVDSYLQSLLAYWYRPERVPKPPLPPNQFTRDEIKRFLNNLRLTDALERVNVPGGGSGPLNVFLSNPMATTEAFMDLSKHGVADIWRRVLPSPEVITLELNEKDKSFVGDVVFQYSMLWSAAKGLKFKHKQRGLSGVLRPWRKKLVDKKPPLGELIFLCEKFEIFKVEGVLKREYEQLRSTYQEREAR